MSTEMQKLDPDKDLCGEQHPGQMAAWTRHAMDRPFDVRTSLPTEEPTHRMLILSIVDSDCIAGGDMIGKEFDLGDYIIHPVELRDEETGEVSEELRCILPQEGGPPIAFVSRGVIKSIQKVAWAVGRTPPFRPPIRVRLKQVAVRGGKRTFKLVPA